VQGRRLSVAAVVVVLGALAFATGAQACSCAPISRSEAMKAADAAFAGRLLKVVPRNHQRALYRYQVQRVYKSGGGIKPGSIISVDSAGDSAACGLPTEIGRRYGLLLSQTENGWASGACAMLGKSGCTS
jgi:hypothetical protein